MARPAPRHEFHGIADAAPLQPGSTAGDKTPDRKPACESDDDYARDRARHPWMMPWHHPRRS